MTQPGFTPSPEGWPPTQQPTAPPPAAADPGFIELSENRGSQGGAIKCATCGSSDIRYLIEFRSLVCANCRSRWNEPPIEAEVDLTGGIRDLRGTELTRTAQDLSADQATMTFKCSGCGAEVVINTAETGQVRCHWCRTYLSAGAQIANGAVPDAILPFLVPQAHAVEIIRGFVSQRKFYAHPRFKREFQPENVVGVYLPYFVFDGHATGEVTGQGEIETRRWREKQGENTYVTYYAADVHDVARRFDLSIDDLLLESNAERANMADPSQTNNIINAILPFDVKSALRYNPNYLRGFTSETRNVNVSQLDQVVEDRLLSITRAKADQMVRQYDRGVRWDTEHVDLHGSRWVTAYLPIWLYSYYQPEKGLKHFVAVNGQNGNVMGSIPLNMPVLILMTLLVLVVGTVLGILVFVPMMMR
ncbi:TFIIB-type zinc ribbon-containing protein [Arachnia propionica]|uniref:TFIIB-type zinc ribbon-containing protein n=1 Tax=Arachnia propionica TaxID=1750 RepID=A0A3P1T8Q5_9ACTN|nr:TFIIB-type zinc ribbon-containing protein [Arachnia propionica]RRD05720.1 TFIIB-type zinc ribbon-containing protein [Arachnia propionica]